MLRVVFSERFDHATKLAIWGPPALILGQSPLQGVSGGDQLPQPVEESPLLFCGENFEADVRHCPAVQLAKPVIRRLRRLGWRLQQLLKALLKAFNLPRRPPSKISLQRYRVSPQHGKRAGNVSGTDVWRSSEGAEVAIGNRPHMSVKLRPTLGIDALVPKGLLDSLPIFRCTNLRLFRRLTHIVWKCRHYASSFLDRQRLIICPAR
jgi:hypothetical protein